MRPRRRRLQRARRRSLTWTAERFGRYTIGYAECAVWMEVTWRGQRVQFYVSDLVAERCGLGPMSRWKLSRLPGLILLLS